MKLGMPRWVVLQLLEGCNLRCKMCYEWGETGSYKSKGKYAELSLEVVRRIIRDLAEARPHYDLFGGEPLLYPHIEEVLKLIKLNKSDIDIPTNGTLIGEYAQTLVDLQVDRLWLSLDGPEEINDIQRGKGVYKKVIHGMNKVYNYRMKKGSDFPRIGISTTVTPFNYKYIEDFYLNCFDLDRISNISIELQVYTTKSLFDEYSNILKQEFNIDRVEVIKGLIREKGEFSEIDAANLAKQLAKIKRHCEAKGVYVNTYPRSVDEDSITKYFNAKWHEIPGSKKICPFPFMELEVSAKGYVTSCHAMYDLVLGNVYKQDIMDIWNGEAYKKFRKFIKSRLMPVCPACCLFYNEKPAVEY